MTENTFWRDLTSGKFAQMVRDDSRTHSPGLVFPSLAEAG